MLNICLKSKYKDSLSSETYLFVSQRTNKPFNRVSITRIFKQIYQVFGLDLASYAGRHVFCTKLVQNGVSPYIIQKLLNHKNLSTTMHHFNCNEETLLNACETNIKI